MFHTLYFGVIVFLYVVKDDLRLHVNIDMFTCLEDKEGREISVYWSYVMLVILQIMIE